MVCLACRRYARGRLCPDCTAHLRPGLDQLLDGGLRLRSAFLHRGPARLLVHNLKYRGIEAAGRLLAEAMAGLIPTGATLIPVPRTVWRELRHGIDPAAVLASSLADLTGGHRSDLLVPPWFGASQARASRQQRKPPIFRATNPVKGPVVMVDDVVTTGGTFLNAWRALGCGPALAVSATSAGGPLGTRNAEPGPSSGPFRHPRAVTSLFVEGVVACIHRDDHVPARDLGAGREVGGTDGSEGPHPKHDS